MDETSNLLLPYILAAQAQKHVTHNEALRKLDALVQICIADRDLSSPPPSPAEGTRYIVAASPTGAWAGSVGRVAAWQDGAWAIYQPRKGWLAWIEDEGTTVAWNGTAWVSIGGSVNPAPLIGVNTTADSTNRLAISSDASLFNHAGAGHQLKINKNAAANTASILFQTGFSGRAEMGLSGTNNFSFKVSPNGTAWFDAISINSANGQVAFPNTSIGGGGVSDGDKGDVTVSGSGATWTIDANAVMNAKLATVATATIKGRATAGAGAVEDLTAAQARGVLGVREALTANRTYFVRTDGNDANTGFANTSGGAFLTIQRAYNVILTLDLNGFDVTISVQSGTYTAGLVCSVPPLGGRVFLAGSSATISTTNASCVTVAAPMTLKVSGLTLQTTTGGNCLYCDQVGGATINIGAGIVFGPCAGYHKYALGGGTMISNTGNNNYTITGGAVGHNLANLGGSIVEALITVTLTPAMSFSFTIASNCGTYSGYLVTYSGGANYFPGNAAGVAATGGQYA